MALTHNRFKILNALSTASGATQRELSAMTAMGLATVNAALKECLDAGLVDDGRLTAKGMAELKPYEVENAVILAAGLSSRFAPISYERPKGLLSSRASRPFCSEATHSSTCSGATHRC